LKNFACAAAQNTRLRLILGNVAVGKVRPVEYPERLYEATDGESTPKKFNLKTGEFTILKPSAVQV